METRRQFISLFFQYIGTNFLKMYLIRSANFNKKRKKVHLAKENVILFYKKDQHFSKGKKSDIIEVY